MGPQVHDRETLVLGKRRSTKPAWMIYSLDITGQPNAKGGRDVSVYSHSISFLLLPFLVPDSGPVEQLRITFMTGARQEPPRRYGKKTLYLEHEFDCTAFLELEREKRLAVLIQNILSALQRLYNAMGWDTGSLLSGHAHLLASGCEARGSITDGPLKSKDGKHWGLMNYCWNESRFELRGVVMDNDLKVIWSEVLIRAEPQFGWLVMYGKVRWVSRRLEFSANYIGQWHASVDLGSRRRHSPIKLPALKRTKRKA